MKGLNWRGFWQGSNWRGFWQGSNWRDFWQEHFMTLVKIHVLRRGFNVGDMWRFWQPESFGIHLDTHSRGVDHYLFCERHGQLIDIVIVLTMWIPATGTFPPSLFLTFCRSRLKIWQTQVQFPWSNTFTIITLAVL